MYVFMYVCMYVCMCVCICVSYEIQEHVLVYFLSKDGAPIEVDIDDESSLVLSPSP